MLYILHFSEPIGNPLKTKGQAQHYTGCCRDGRLQDRLLEHRAGLGAKLTAAVARLGISIEVGATLPGHYTEEKALKLMHNGPRYCTICRQQRLLEKIGL